MKFLHKALAPIIRRLTLMSAESWRNHGYVGDAGEDVSADAVLGLSAVWACVNLLAGTISSLPLVVYRTDAAGTRSVARDHPLYRVLHDSPNFDQTAVDFWDFMCTSIELWGDAFAHIKRGSRGIVALTPILPAAMSVRRLQSGTIEYRWTENGKSFVETDSVVLHIRGPGGNPLGGMSTLRYGRHVFSLSRAVDRSAAATFRNGMRASGVLTFERWLSPEQREIAEKQMAEKYTGAMNTGKPLILEGGTKWQQITLNPEDAQMLESRGLSVEEICRYFGTPPHMIGHTAPSTSWGTGLEQQTLGFQKFTLRRRLKRIEKACEKQLLTPEDLAAGISIEFNIDGLLRGDSAGRARFYQTMTTIGAMTINEVRALENLPAVEGGDVPRVQMQNQPIAEIDREALREAIALEREENQ